MGKVIRTIVLMIVSIALGVGGCLYYLTNNNADKANFTSEIVYAKLSAASELTSGKIKMQGYIHFDNKGIPVLTKGTFILEYEAEVRAGIDISKVTIDSVDNENKVIKVTVSKAEILDVNVDQDSLQTNNTSFTLFNLNEKQDLINAQQAAKEKALEYAEQSGLLELADQQSATLIKGILSSGFPDYTIDVANK